MWRIWIGGALIVASLCGLWLHERDNRIRQQERAKIATQRADSLEHVVVDMTKMDSIKTRQDSIEKDTLQRAATHAKHVATLAQHDADSLFNQLRRSLADRPDVQAVVDSLEQRHNAIVANMQTQIEAEHRMRLIAEAAVARKDSIIGALNQVNVNLREALQLQPKGNGIVHKVVSAGEAALAVYGGYKLIRGQ